MNFASGCCNNYGGPDFSKMDFKTLTCRVAQVNWCEKNFWISIAAIFCLPAFCATVRCMRCSPVPCMSSSHFLEMLVFTVNILKLYIFFQMVDRQPRWAAMLDSNIHSAGYLMVGIGLLLSTACLGVFGPCDTFVRVEPPVSSRGKQGSRYIRRRYRDLARVLKTASFFCHLGYSLIDIAPRPLILNLHPEPHLSRHIHATNNLQGAFFKPRGCAGDSAASSCPLLWFDPQLIHRGCTAQSWLCFFACQGHIAKQKKILYSVIGVIGSILFILFLVMVICCAKEKYRRMKKKKKRANRMNARGGQVAPAGMNNNSDSSDDSDSDDNANRQLNTNLQRLPDPSLWAASNFNSTQQPTTNDLWNPISREMWRQENGHMMSSPPSYRSTDGPAQGGAAKSKKKKRGRVAPSAGESSMSQAPNANYLSGQQQQSQQVYMQQQQLVSMLHSGIITQHEYQQRVAALLQPSQTPTVPQLHPQVQDPMQQQQQQQQLQQQQQFQQYQQQLQMMLQQGQISQEQYQQQLMTMQQSLQQQSQQTNPAALQQYQQRLQLMLQQGQITQIQYQQQMQLVQQNLQQTPQQSQQLQQLEGMLNSGLMTALQFLQQLATLLQSEQISVPQYLHHLDVLLRSGQIPAEQFEQQLSVLKQGGQITTQQYQQQLHAALEAGHISQQQYQQYVPTSVTAMQLSTGQSVPEQQVSQGHDSVDHERASEQQTQEQRTEMERTQHLQQAQQQVEQGHSLQRLEQEQQQQEQPQQPLGQNSLIQESSNQDHLKQGNLGEEHQRGEPGTLQEKEHLTIEQPDIKEQQESQSQVLEKKDTVGRSEGSAQLQGQGDMSIQEPAQTSSSAENKKKKGKGKKTGSEEASQDPTAPSLKSADPTVHMADTLMQSPQGGPPPQQGTVPAGFDPSLGTFNPSSGQFDPNSGMYSSSSVMYDPNSGMYNPSMYNPNMYNPSSVMYDPNSNMYQAGMPNSQGGLTSPQEAGIDSQAAGLGNSAPPEGAGHAVSAQAVQSAPQGQGLQNLNSLATPNFYAGGIMADQPSAALEGMGTREMMMMSSGIPMAEEVPTGTEEGEKKKKKKKGAKKKGRDAPEQEMSASGEQGGSGGVSDQQQQVSEL